MRELPAHVSADPVILQRYIAYRQRVVGHLLEVNKSAVLQTLDKLGNFLEQSCPVAQDQRVLAKIGQDFGHALNEFLAEHKIEQLPLPIHLDSDSISAAIAQIARTYGGAMDAALALHKESHRLDLAAVQAFIDQHFQDPISLDTIAQRFFVSREHLSRAFKAYCGETISDTIIRKRMEKARELIVAQNLAIKEAAELTGYSDIAYFYRVFKKHFGYTPGDLRRNE